MEHINDAPMSVARRARGLPAVVFALALLASFTVPAGNGRIDSLWSTNGNVYAMAASGNTLYIGGDFTYVGPSTGSWAGLETGSAGYDAAWPTIVGTVYAAIPDGTGGWYLGGDITQVGATSVSSIAHIKADKSVDTAFTATADSTVWTLALVGNTLYVGGQFSQLDGQSRFNLGAVDAATGAVNAWNPAANSVVYTLVVSGATLYTGGSFTSLGGVTRNRIAAIDTTTGTVTAWNPNANTGTVFSLVVDGAIVYAGGGFTSIGGQSRNRIAALDMTTGLATVWNPNVNSANVRCMALSGSLLYVGGGFTAVGGQTRNRIAAVDTATGFAAAWNPNTNAPVRALTVVGSTVYIGGTFTTVGGQTFNHIAAIDTATGATTSWNPSASGNVYTLTMQGSQLFAGGAFTSLGGVTRNHIAAIDTVSGHATAWDPDISGVAILQSVTVYALAIDGDTLYAGGYFSAVGGITRNNIAAIDAATGMPSDWDPNITGNFFYNNVRTLALDDSVVYAGGWFYDVGGVTRNNLTAIDKTSGAVTAWDPNVNGQVYTIVRDNTSLYVGGSFSTIGGASRNNLGQLDTAIGLASSWTANTDSTVSAIALDGSTLYVGGGFLNINGTPRAYLGAVDKSTAVLGAWSPSVDSSISALVMNGPNVYIGGDFSNINGATRYYLGSVDKTSGAVTAWDPEPDTSISSLAADGDRLYLGGYYDSFYATTWQGLSAVGFTPPEAAATPTAGVYGASQSVTLNCTDHSGDGCSGLHYTLDGSAPTRASSMYSAPLTIAGNGTLKFFATDNDGIDGMVQTASYVIDSSAPVTAASLSGGLFNIPQSVTLSCSDANSGCAATYYTTDGNVPTTSSTPYAGAITISSNTDLKFFSVDNAGNAETARSVSYVIDAAAPVTSASVAGGTYSSAQTVVLGCVDANSGCAATYYTTDGSAPTPSSATFAGLITITANTTLKFLSVDNAGNAEAAKSVSYIIDAVAPVTSASVAGGTYSSAQTVVFSCVDANSGCAATYYTTDGSVPTPSSATFAGPITISANTTLKFLSVDQAGNPEAVQSENYLIDSSAPMTTPAPDAGTYNSAQTISLLCSDDNSGCATTYFTTDNSAPSLLSTRYIDPFTLYMNTTVRFFSIDAAGNAETDKSAFYAINTAPVAVDASLSAVEDTPLNGQLHASDLQGDVLAFGIVSGPGKGRLVITDAASGTFVYTPDTDFNGADSFTFKANDSQFDSNTATVTIVVTAVNDPPTVLGNGINGIIARVGGVVSVTFGVQDVDGGDTHTYNANFASSSASTASVGSAVMTGARLDFTPLAAGSDTLTVTVTDSGGLTSNLSLPVTVTAGSSPLIDSNADGLSNSAALNLGLDQAIPSGDSDGDGIVDALEVGDPKHPADGDGDGVIDALEIGTAANDPQVLYFRVPDISARVLNLPDLSGQVLRLSGSGALSAHNNASLGLPVYAKSQVATPDPGYDYPYGVLDFSVVAADGTATVTLQLPPSMDWPENLQVRKYGSAGWRTLTDAAIDRVNHTITLHLADNDDVDLDPRTGIIRDPVGLTVPASSGGGGAVEPLWLFALLGAWRRRARATQSL